MRTCRLSASRTSFNLIMVLAFLNKFFYLILSKRNIAPFVWLQYNVRENVGKKISG